MAQLVKKKKKICLQCRRPRRRGSTPGLEAPLEEETAIHSICLSPSAASDSLNLGLRRGGQILQHLSYRAHPHGQRSLGGYRAWGHERVGHAWAQPRTTSVSYLSPSSRPFVTRTPENPYGFLTEGGNRQKRRHLVSRTPSRAGPWTLSSMPNIYGNDIPTGKPGPPPPLGWKSPRICT